MELLGKDGITQLCLDAIVRLLSFGNDIEKAVLISCIDSSTQCGTHAFLLIDCFEDIFCIRSGFASGYSGEGPAGLSKALSLLLKHEIHIDEIIVSSSLVGKLNSGRLSLGAIEKILLSKPVRPTRYYEYIQNRHDRQAEYVKRLYPLKVPLGLIDDRIMDLALSFDEDPDLSLLKGYRRLEDSLRKRTGISEATGNKLFAKVFNGESSVLCWKNVDSTEALGRANLFSAIFMGYRNSRTHKEVNTSKEGLIREFLMLNELFVLESTSIVRKVISLAETPKK